jgi:hypothetical protein
LLILKICFGFCLVAEKITESLKDMAKKVDPIIVAPVPSLRKAMGILPGTSPPASPTKVVDAETLSIETGHEDGEQRRDCAASVTDGITTTCTSGRPNTTAEVSGMLNESVPSEPVVEEVDVEGTSSQPEAEEEAGEVGDVPDLESELREFLESEPALSNSPLQDDRTIEEILSES